MANDIKWIKINTDIFDDEKFSIIDSMPDADAIELIWFKLLVFAGKSNNNGLFFFNDRVAYTDEMLASIFRRPLNTVRLALKTFQELGMIEEIDGVYSITNWSKHQSLDSYEAKKKRDREYQQKRRLEQKQMIEDKKSSENRLTENDLSSDAMQTVGRFCSYSYSNSISISNSINKDNKDNTNNINNKYKDIYNNLIKEFNISSYLLNYIEDWIEYKKERRFTYKERGLRTLIKTIANKAEQFGEEQVGGIISESISNGYQGIVWNQLERKGRSNGSGRTTKKYSDTIFGGNVKISSGQDESLFE